MKNKSKLTFQKSTVTELNDNTMLKIFGGVNTDDDNGNTIVLSTGRCGDEDDLGGSL